MTASERARTTYRLELQRAVANGVLESAGSTFLLLIALKYFQAGALAKALVAGGGSVGLMLTPLVVSLVARRGWPAAAAAARFAWVGAGTLVLMAGVPWLPLYVAGAIVSMAAAAGVIPLLTQIYQDNYPEDQRGKLFARAVMLRIAVNAAFSELAGRLLAGAVIFGIANAGGDVAWGLWVTKLAPPERVADYMSVHTFFTGVRGVTAPVAAFYAAQSLALGTIGLVCAGLILAASLLLVPEIRWARTARPGRVPGEQPLAE